MVAQIPPIQPNVQNTNPNLSPSVAQLSRLANDPMNFPNPQLGVINPPNKKDAPLSADAFEQKDKPPSRLQKIKKGVTATNLILIGKLAVCAISAFYLGKGIKHVGSKISKLLKK